jgi:hypothetical protein
VDRLQGAMARWTLVWLHRHWVGAVRASAGAVLAYLRGDVEGQARARERVIVCGCVIVCAQREAIESGLLPDAKKLLNLAGVLL